MRKKAPKIALNRETLRRLDEERLRQGAAGELTGTATLSCPDRTCGNCLSAYLAPCT